jgi:hypothetical protein
LIQTRPLSNGVLKNPPINLFIGYCRLFYRQADCQYISSGRAWQVSADSRQHEWLIFIPPPASGLGSLTCHKIVVKRPFHKVNTGPLSYKIDRFALADSDVLKIFKEANVPYCAKSLLQFTYGFIDRCLSPLSRVSHLKPPCIPCVRFVAADTSSAGSNGSTRTAVYVLLSFYYTQH